MGPPGFLEAALHPLKGLGFLLRRPALWPPAAAAFAVNVILFTAALIAFIVWLPDLARAATPDRFPAWTAWIAGVLLAAAGLLATLFLFTIVGNAVAAPFLDALAARALKDLGETLPPGAPLGRALLRSVGGQLLKLALFGSVQALLLLSLLTPLGLLYPILAGVVAAFFFALEYVDYPLGARGVGNADRLRFVAGRPRPFLGFGAACLLLQLVPLLGYLAMPASVCGAVLLVRRLEPR
jgi:CysZ protein